MKKIALFILLVILAIPATIVGFQWWHEPDAVHSSAAVTDTAAQIVKGEYLARAGDCMACHTSRGGKAYAGGRAIPTPFGDIYSPNITPDVATGIGSWSADDFWRALHNGKSKDGSFLYPAFPYPNYTKVTRADSDAMHAYFKTLPAISQPRREHALRFPYNQRWLLAGWRALYFKPGVYQPDTGQSLDWNRGAYLVQGLGHCSACHTNRNVLGAPEEKADLAGGMIPVLNWYAPSLTSDVEAGLGHWEVQHISDLLKTGVSPRGTVFGPMAEVVRESLQHLSDPDIDAMSGYLKSLPQNGGAHEVPSVHMSPRQTDYVLKLGAKLYEDNCAECHQENGSGKAPDYPPLAGNRSVTLPSSVNPIRIVLNGGYPPSTHGNPRPYGMPPYGPFLDDGEVAAVVSYIRNAWGNRSGMVTPAEISQYRAVPVE